MGCREEFERVLAGQRFAFCLLVHTDVGSPMIDFLDASSVLQVHSLHSCMLHEAAQERRDAVHALRQSRSRRVRLPAVCVHLWNTCLKVLTTAIH